MEGVLPAVRAIWAKLKARAVKGAPWDPAGLLPAIQEICREAKTDRPVKEAHPVQAARAVEAGAGWGPAEEADKGPSVHAAIPGLFTTLAERDLCAAGRIGPVIR